jgi:hypothetical protein
VAYIATPQNFSGLKSLTASVLPYGRRARDGTESQASFHPEKALFPNLCVNLHVCLCGVNSYASAQPFDFLDLGKNC